MSEEQIHKELRKDHWTIENTKHADGEIEYTLWCPACCASNWGAKHSD
jgi:hypothetical protein